MAKVGGVMFWKLLRSKDFYWEPKIISEFVHLRGANRLWDARFFSIVLKRNQSKHRESEMNFSVTPLKRSFTEVLPAKLIFWKRMMSLFYLFGSWPNLIFSGGRGFAVLPIREFLQMGCSGRLQLGTLVVESTT